MEMVADLLKRDPSLKVIYLVRDPRGIVASRIATRHVSAVSARSATREASFLCARMLFDLTLYANLRAKYPHNIVQVKYEDIVKAPQEKAAFLYQFTRQSPVPEYIVSFIRESTHAKKDSGPFDTLRKNATASAYRWTKQLSNELKRSISGVCKDVLQMLGYNWRNYLLNYT